MPLCKYCGIPFAWGYADGEWIPLVPIEDHANMVRSYQDENGVLRAEHRAICTNYGGPTVRVARLMRNIKPEDVVQEIDPETGEIKNLQFAGDKRTM